MRNHVTNYCYYFSLHLSAERKITNEELEDMLESGNPAIFTQEVRFTPLSYDLHAYKKLFLNSLLSPLAFPYRSASVNSAA